MRVVVPSDGDEAPEAGGAGTDIFGGSVEEEGRLHCHKGRDIHGCWKRIPQCHEPRCDGLELGFEKGVRAKETTFISGRAPRGKFTWIKSQG